MDFLRIIRSLEELLYEVMGWLVFYPRTMWRIVARPVSMMRYSDREQADTPEQQYADTLSPPLFLMLTILLAHGFALAMGAKMPEARNAVARMLLSSEQNLLILRSILFSIFALVAATTLIKRRQRALDRATLRAPFFTQCYLTAPFALAVSVAATLVGTHRRPCTWRARCSLWRASPGTSGSKHGGSGSNSISVRAGHSSSPSGVS